MSSIRARGLTKDFGDLGAVDNLDLDLPQGGATGFVGPNGAGKSTTIRMLLGLIEPTSGEGEVLGHSITTSAYLHRVGALIGSPAFYPSLTGEENLRVFATLGGHDRHRIAEMLQMVVIAYGTAAILAVGYGIVSVAVSSTTLARRDVTS